MKFRKISLARVNRFLVLLIVAINAWIILVPLYPIVVFWWQKNLKHQPQRLQQLVSERQSNPAKVSVPAGEHLIIPTIALNENIHEGASVYTANKGVWHFPDSSSPDKAGNTVFIGHRFTYSGPSVFAHLDLVKPGDTIAVWWNGKQFIYKVSQIKVITPNDTVIIEHSTDTRLTIYTCTPMWSTKYRLAIIAEQEKL